jgi:hypothetical protein
LAALFYVFLLFLLIVDFGAGLVLALLSAGIWLIYSRRSQMPLLSAPERREKTVGWGIVGFLGFLFLGTAGPVLNPISPTPPPPAAAPFMAAPSTPVEPTEAKATATNAPTRRPAATKPPDTDTPEPPLPTAIPPTAASVPTTAPPTAAPPTGHDPNTNQNCDSFPSYEQMQAFRRYWQARGIANPGGLDGDSDGLACEDGEGGRPAAPPPAAAPFMAAPAQPPAPAGVSCGGYRKCDTFGTWREAQDYFEACGYGRMDADNDGIACENLPGAP